MDLLDWIGILLRRWKLTVPLLLLALGGVGAAATVTPWTYEARANLVFLASPFQARQAGGNPWLVFDSSLTVTAEVVGREMMDDRTAAGLRGRGLTAAYEIGVAQDSTGPVLAVDVSGDDPRVTKATLDALVAEIPRRLTQIQVEEGVTERAQIKASVVTASPKAALAATGKLRVLVMALFVGLALTVAVPLFAEVLSERRRRGRAPDPEPAPAPDPAPEKPNGVTLPDLTGSANGESAGAGLVRRSRD
ncbi:hypothetical protein [Actinomadura rugatobispora]|uniref:Polysaccharide chain length determinant N-terminal domain-containing protein n=1 Tax=Actinomadura rugatobispora TaxID=1994 RepID=A0ABW1AC69_9ACTN|nr:hypothetical protein GCM10010200_066940 [Actinomadura rugatobispora]